MICFNHITERKPDDAQKVIVITSDGEVKNNVIFSTGATGKEYKWVSWPEDIEDVIFWLPERIAI